MPRAGINKAVVQNAREALLARGVHPSVDAIRVELGNTGSKTTIQRYLKELTEPNLPKAVTALRDELVHHVEIVAKRIIEETRLQVATEQPHLDIACQPLTLTEAQNADLITDLQKQLADQRTALENLNRQKHTLEQRCTTLSERNGHLEALLEQELQLKCGPDHQHDEQQIQELREALQNLQASLLQTQAELLGLYREQSRSTGKAR